MNLEQALNELRAEPVPEDAVEHAIRTLERPGTVKRRRSVWLVPVATTLFVAGYAFWPARGEDRVWASAILALEGAQSLHIRFVKPLETFDFWRKQKKMRLISDYGELRYNGSALTSRIGFLSSSERIQKNGPLMTFGMDLMAFESVESKIKDKKAVPTKIRRNGKELLSYDFGVANSYDGDVRIAKSTDRYPFNHHVGSIRVIALVDPSQGRIVGLGGYEAFDPGYPESMRRAFSNEGFSATVDYPDDIPDSMFNPPAKTFTYADSKKEVARLLSGSLGEATVHGRKIVLKGVLCDGMHVYAVWDGCAGNYNGAERFQIDGVELGQASDVRCLSSAKCRKPESAACPHSLLGADVSKPLPDRVDLTLPIFGPDYRRPVMSEKHRVLGFFSVKVGEARFKNIPVTPIKPLGGFYEREFGLYRNFW